MPKRIKHVAELPEWFKLEKYNFTKNMDAIGWYQQLSIRGICLYRASEHIQNKQSYSKELQLAIQALRENPNYDILNDKKLASYFSQHNLLYLLNFQKNTQALLGVSSLTMREYVCTQFFLDSKRLALAEKWYNTPEEKRQMYPKNAPWLDEPLHNSYQPEVGVGIDTLKIDLSFPDSFLIENFTKYLANRRKSSKAKSFIARHFRKSDFNNWSKLGVLPYLDLILLEYEIKKRIPNRIIADALYPSGDKGEETIRKTTNALANQLTGGHTLHQLGAQAALEIAGKNKI